jgi:phage baseplate assembly protein W
MEYLVLPFKLTHDYLGRGDLLQSITHSVGLILSTRAGRMPFHPEYGCSIWEKEYADLYATSKSDIRASLRNAIDILEKRLYNLSVSFTQESKSGVDAIGLHVKVTGNFRDGTEEQKFEAVYHLT